MGARARAGGIPGDRRRQRFDRRLGRGRAGGGRDRGAASREGASALRCTPGVAAARAPIVAVCDADASLDPATCRRVVDPVLRGEQILSLGRRVPIGRLRLAVPRPVANAVLCAASVRSHTSRCRHRTDAGGPTEALRGLDIRDRRSGYPLEMVLRAASEAELADRRVRWTTARGSAAPRSPERCAARSRRSATCSRAAEVRMSAVTVVIMAKECLPGRVKTRLHPPFTLEEAARIAPAALDDTLASIGHLDAGEYFACRASFPRSGSNRSPRSPATSMSASPRCSTRISGAVLLIGMDTPQFTPGNLRWPTTSTPGRHRRRRRVLGSRDAGAAR